MDWIKYFEREAVAAYKTKEIYQQLKNVEQLKSILEINSLYNGVTSFQTKFKKTKSDFTALSIATPSDCDYIEIALIGKGGLVFHPEFGYEDIRRFESVDEIINEIIRLDTNPIMMTMDQGQDITIQS
jgi:hypothetical protein